VSFLQPLSLICVKRELFLTLKILGASLEMNERDTLHHGNRRNYGNIEVKTYMQMFHFEKYVNNDNREVKEC